MFKPIQYFLFISFLFCSTFLSAEQINLALLPFTSEVTTNDFSKALSVFEVSAENCREALLTELVRSSKVRVIERDALKKIISEQAFEQTGLTETNNAIQLGKMLNLRFILKGRVYQSGLSSTLSANVISIETGEIVASERIEGITGKDLIAKSKILAKRIESVILKNNPTLGKIESTSTTPPEVTSTSNQVQDSTRLISTNVKETNEYGMTFFQLAFFNPLQLFPASFDVFGFSLGVIWSENRDIFGFNTGLILIVKEQMVGLQSGFLSLSSKTVGAQAGFINITGFLDGAQVGFINKADDLVGAQVGFINVARIVRGAQIGFLNFAQRLYGTQVGFLNFVSRSPGVPVMIGVNIGF